MYGARAAGRRSRVCLSVAAPRLLFLMPVTWGWVAFRSTYASPSRRPPLPWPTLQQRSPPVITTRSSGGAAVRLLSGLRGGADDGGATLKLTPEAIKSFTEQGPLYPLCFPPHSSPPPPTTEWLAKGKILLDKLGITDTLGITTAAATTNDAAAGPPPISMQAARRVFHLYLPIYFWILGLLRQRKEAQLAGKGASSGPLVVGLSAPQGSGKTTIVKFLQQLMEEQAGMRTVVLSIDDFYLTNAQQNDLAARFPDNRLLQCRGNAGTHDVELGRETIERCRQARSSRDKVALPSYDKSIHSGRGDRLPREQWPVVQGPIDLLIVEGWMLGFQPLPPAERGLLERLDPGLPQVNAELSRYKEAWHSQMDAWVVVEVGDDIQWVYEWRREAEEKMKAVRGPGAGMTDEQVRDFVSRYMPAYHAYLPGLYQAEKGRWTVPTLRFRIGRDRSPL